MSISGTADEANHTNFAGAVGRVLRRTVTAGIARHVQAANFSNRL